MRSPSFPGAGRQFLLVVFCLMLGLLVGYKLAKRELVWMLCPCHVVTSLQIYLLATSPTSKYTNTIFR